MEFVSNIFSERIIEALSWTLIHSIWQGLLVACLMSVILYGIRNQSSRVKYLAAHVSLWTVLFLVVLTFLDQWNQVSMSSAFVASGEVAINHSLVIQEVAAGTFSLETYFPLIISVWLLGLIFFALKIGFGLSRIQKIRSGSLKMSAFWENKLQEFKNKIGYSGKVQIRLSSAINMPMVVGVFKPLILFPVGLISQLEIEEVEAIIVHELAHIVRADYFFNLLQSCIEALLYFNPGVWWISAMIRSERENCCDDLALDVCGNSIGYAKALVKLEEMQATAPSLAVALFRNKKSLLIRIKRILDMQQIRNIISEKILISALLVFCLSIFALQQNNAQVKDSLESMEDIKIETDESALAPAPPAPPAPPSGASSASTGTTKGTKGS